MTVCDTAYNIQKKNINLALVFIFVVDQIFKQVYMNSSRAYSLVSTNFAVVQQWVFWGYPIPVSLAI